MALRYKTYWFVKQNTTQEIVENLSDFWVAGNVFLVTFDELIFPDREVLKDFVIKVDFTEIHRVFFLIHCFIIYN
jgi:hypothetical protein